MKYVLKIFSHSPFERKTWFQIGNDISAHQTSTSIIQITISILFCIGSHKLSDHQNTIAWTYREVIRLAHLPLLKQKPRSLSLWCSPVRECTSSRFLNLWHRMRNYGIMNIFRSTIPMPRALSSEHETSIHFVLVTSGGVKCYNNSAGNMRHSGSLRVRNTY